MTLSIVIVNHNTFHVLGYCLDSVLKSDLRLPYEIIVVDNHSSDDGWLSLKARYPDVVRFLESQTNLGYPGGANIGIRAARGSVVLLLNPDAEVKSDTLRILYERLISSANIGIAGPKVFYADGRLQSVEVPKQIPGFLDLFFDMFYINRLFKNHGLINRYYGADFDYDREQLVGQAHGSCFMVKKEVFDRAGLLDEKFFLYFDEADFCLRASRAGYHSLYAPSASIVHRGGESANWMGRRRMRLYYESIFYFFKKHHGKWQTAVLYGVSLTAALFRMLLIPVYVFRDRNLGRVRMHFWTLADHLTPGFIWKVFR